MLHWTFVLYIYQGVQECWLFAATCVEPLLITNNVRVLVVSRQWTKDHRLLLYVALYNVLRTFHTLVYNSLNGSKNVVGILCCSSHSLEGLICPTTPHSYICNSLLPEKHRNIVHTETAQTHVCQPAAAVHCSEIV